MRTVLTGLLLLTLSISTLAPAQVGPPKGDSTRVLFSKGQDLRNGLKEQFDPIKAAAGDPRMIETYERVNKQWSDLVQPLSNDQIAALTEYVIGSKEDTSDFGQRLSGFVVVQAVNGADVELLKRVLACVSVESMDGHYLEWMLQKKTGRAVEILADAYKHALTHKQAEVLAECFRRAFSNVDGDHLTDDRYVDACTFFYRHNADRLHLNDHYQSPPQMNPPLMDHAEPADPDAGLLFCE